MPVRFSRFVDVVNCQLVNAQRPHRGLSGICDNSSVSTPSFSHFVYTKRPSLLLGARVHGFAGNNTHPHTSCTNSLPASHPSHRTPSKSKEVRIYQISHRAPPPSHFGAYVVLSCKAARLLTKKALRWEMILQQSTWNRHDGCGLLASAGNKIRSRKRQARNIQKQKCIGAAYLCHTPANNM